MQRATRNVSYGHGDVDVLIIICSRHTQDEQLPLGTTKGEDASSEEAEYQKPVHMS